MCSFFPVCLPAQIRVISGTGLTVEPGTTLHMHSAVTDSFVIENTATVINHGQVILDPLTQLVEQPGFPITGDGFETVTKNVVLSSSSQGINGLGLLLKGNGSGMLTVNRWHQASLNQAGDVSVKRLFKINAAAGIDYQAGFHYDLTELNSLHADELMLYTSADSMTWVNEGGDVSTDTVSYTGNLEDVNFITVYEASTSVAEITDTLLCVNDSLLVELTNTGLFNNNSLFILEYDTDPLFSSPVEADTVNETGGVLTLVPLTGLPGGTALYIRVRTENPHTGFVDLGELSVFSYPTVSMTGLAAYYCSNAPLESIIVSPVGGTMTGTGWTGSAFDPQIAGSGLHVLTYSFENAGGCVSEISDSTTVTAAPVASLTSVQTNFCAGDDTVELNGLPINGNYGGTGVTDSIFDPALAGTGNFDITYQVTDGFGCTDTDTLEFIVSALPVISLGPDQAVCLNNAPLNLLAAPAGGTWSGTGIDAMGNFDPSAAGTGNFEMIYAYTDAGTGCSNTDSVEMTVNPIPATPVISRNTDTLVSSVTADHYQWYVDGNPISGSDAVSIIVSANGDYTVEVTNAEGCSSMSAIYHHTTAGIAVNTQNTFNVYPNPVIQGGNIFVSGNTEGIGYILYSAEGKVIGDGAVINNEVVVNTLTTGVYFLQLNHSQQVLMTHKIMVTE